MNATPTYYRMMKSKCRVGLQLAPKGGPHINPDVEKILASHRKDGQIDRADVVYFAETPEFASLGIGFDEGYIHIVEPIGDVQRRDQAWLGELQLRHHTNKELATRESPQRKARRKEFEGMSDKDLCERYFSGALSNRPTIELMAKGAKVIGYHSEEAVRVRNTFRDIMPKE